MAIGTVGTPGRVGTSPRCPWRTPEDRRRRLRLIERAQTQSLFERTNERAREMLVVDDDVPCRFGCEYGDVFCTEIVVLTTAQYDAVRVHEGRLVVRPGHDSADSERVVETHAGFLLVESTTDAGVPGQA